MGSDADAGGVWRVQTLGRVLVLGCVVVGICSGIAVVLFRVDGLARRRLDAQTTVFESENAWVLEVTYLALGGAVLIAAVGWPILWSTTLSTWARRALQVAGAVVAAALLVLIARARVEARVTIDAHRGLVIIESRSIADVARRSSGASHAVPLGEVTTVRWTYRHPDGENAELGRVQLELIDDQAVTIPWQYPTSVVYELASTIAKSR